jgi:DNA-3-methyladenine glycosylase II
MTAVPDVLRKAQRHLARRDPVLKQLIAAVGPCTLWHNPDRFASLVRSIISQQISTKAARSISARLEQALGAAGLTPKGILTVSNEALRSAGLSTGKVRSVCDLAEKVHNGSVRLDILHELLDEEVIAHLVPVRGIGRWTAEMFLIFSLGRLDILPVGDLGLRVGVQRQYNLPEPPVKEKLAELAEPWRPYRSIATWYFWRSLGGVPQSNKQEGS